MNIHYFVWKLLSAIYKFSFTHSFIPNTSLSERHPVCCILYCQVPKPKPGKHTTVTHRSYKNFDASAFLRDLSKCPFNEIHGLAESDEALAHFYKLFSSSPTSLILRGSGKSVLKKKQKNYHRCPDSQIRFERP